MTHDEIISAMRRMRDEAEAGLITADQARARTALLIEKLDPGLRRLARTIAIRAINAQLYGVIATTERREAGENVRSQLLALPASIRREISLTLGEMPGSLDEAEAAVLAIKPAPDADARRGYGVSALDRDDALLIIANMRGLEAARCRRRQDRRRRLVEINRA